VVRIQADTEQVRSQLATLLGKDVDVSALMDKIATARPAGTAISTLTVTVSAATAQGGATTNVGGSLDTSGKPHIGTVMLSGTAKRTVDVATYVDNLGGLAGLVDVVPTSNSDSDGKGITFNIQLSMTADLLSHAFAVAPGGN
jgi:hypothetical protein